MGTFDAESRMRNLFGEFQKIDDLVFSFVTDLKSSLEIALKDLTMNDDDDDLIGEYAKSIFHSTESVIDKDINYPEFRMQDEVKRMNRVNALRFELDFNESIRDELFRKTKEIMVRYFQGIYNLSGNGFRLLDATTKMFLHNFIVRLSFHQNEIV